MDTVFYEITDEDIKEAAQVLRDGGLIAFPTETVYGLGANALDEEAVAKVYKAKGRPSDNPMIIHIARASDIGQLTPMLSEEIVKLIDNFWPGPLTLVLNKKEGVPDIVTGGLDTVAVRIPDDDVALKLISEAGVPVAAPSANISGKPSPTKVAHVADDLDGVIDGIILGGECRVGIESTVLDMTTDTPTILRPGIVTWEQIEAVLEKDVAANINVGEDIEGAPKSPGMKYQHYSPDAAMLVVEGRRDKVEAEIERLATLNERLGAKVGTILFEEKAYIEAANKLYDALRELDSKGVDLILAGALSDTDSVGFAVMNRMLKAAGYKIVKV